MIHHVMYEVPKVAMFAERVWWSAIGFARDHQRSRNTTWEGEWLRSRHDASPRWVWLVPSERELGDVTALVVIALVPDSIERVLADLNALADPVPAIELMRHFGERRVSVESPSGYVVELFSRVPRAHRYGPPSDHV